MADTFKYLQTQATTLYGSGAILGATTIILSSLKDLEGNAIAITDLGTYGYGTIEPGTAGQEEAIAFTGITQNANDTATLTGVYNQLGKSPYTKTAGIIRNHAGGTIFVLTNTAGYYDALSGKGNDETISGKYTFPAGGNANAPVSGTVYSAPTDNLEYASKQYADSLSYMGAPNASTTAKGVLEVATEAESLAGTDTGGTGALLGVLPSQIAKNIQNAVYSYAADAGATDAYAITIAPAISAYATGQVFVFKANTINTGAATLNVNAKGAKTIKKNHDQDLEDGDIESGSFVIVIYDGTNFQLQSAQATMPTTALLAEMAAFFGATDITGAEAQTLTSSSSSNADALHTHSSIALNSQAYSVNSVLGKTWATYELPRGAFAGSTANGWQMTDCSLAFGSFSRVFTANGSVKWSGFCRPDRVTGTTGFGNTKKIIIEFYLKVATGAGNATFGWASDNGFTVVYNDATIGAVCFKTNGDTLYAHTSGGGEGTDHTETAVSGITITNNNFYRIEWNPGVNALFYVNGILKATIATTLPTANPMNFGFGDSSNTHAQTVMPIIISQEI